MPASHNLSEVVDDVKSETNLPAARIRIIMKSSADPSVPNIKMEALHLVSKATEMLIKKLAKESIGKNRMLEYRHIADYVQSEKKLEFLHQILPKKITGKAFKKLLQESDSNDSDDSDESDSTSSSSTGEEESSSQESGSSEDDDDDKTEKKTEPKK